ncbi:small GTP-binding protein domain protein [Synechococcus sp. PCC 7502]|uniref:Era-like GTP-binding protein n=1 Tax=Synechococcus sp. PCC 7502 TaxID=1173263 RepID=UPI00029F80C2|nr:Era-like GTP-binding protein [Synechococcus sp. PCC 7502]AFY74686.1 small GTP-binding protein domain protein [Synechococcus sp. PCC 7502]
MNAGIYNEDDPVTWANDRLDHYLHKYAKRMNESDLGKIHSLQAKLKHHIFVIAAVGLASSGKTAVLNAIHGRKNWRTSPLKGTTVSLNYADTDLDSPKVQIKLIDTPGLHEVEGESRAQIAINAAYEADLILFITSKDLTRYELEMIAQLHHAHKPILLIFNKADLYPPSDRKLIHEALQNPELQVLISPDEIIFTSAEPLPRRVRVEYNNANAIQESWEYPPHDVQALKQKLLDLLNQDGKALLAINTMRSLLEIHRNFVQAQLDQLDQFLPDRTFASGIFVIKAISVLLLPFPILDFLGSTLVDSILISAANIFLDYGHILPSLSLSVINSIVLANIDNSYAQIAWIAISTSMSIHWLREDLPKAYPLKQIIKKVKANSTANSILHRLKT